MGEEHRQTHKEDKTLEWILKGNGDEEPPSQVFAMTTGSVPVHLNELIHTTITVKK